MNNQLETFLKADIMIVDDTPENIRFLSSLLQSQGYTVRKAINGKMALTAVKSLLPDLILLDINMPSMNGYEVCKELKKDPDTRSVPVIFLSALDDVKDKVKAFQVGGIDYITKPFQLEEVLVRIKNQLTIRHLQIQLQKQNEQLQQSFQDLQKAQAQLIQKEKMVSLGQLAAGMAHEINNSVGFISGNIDFADQYHQDLLNIIRIYQREHPIPTPALAEELQNIDMDFIIADINNVFNSMRTGTERISTLILALRIFSRLNESDVKSVNLHQGIDSTLLLLQSKMKPERHRSGIQVIKNYSDLPNITCYASQMNQVFLNLLNNAIDALEFGPGKFWHETTIPTIWIGTELTNQERVKITVKDNGMGIEEKIKPNLFNPFFTTKPVGKGSGLGLLTCYEIVVDKHQGQLTYNSQFGQGAEFIVEIPVHLTKI